MSYISQFSGDIIKYGITSNFMVVTTFVRTERCIQNVVKNNKPLV